MNNKMKHLFIELAHHLPYSIFGVTVAILFVGILSFFGALVASEEQFAHASADLFHVFHPAHILLSAVTTTAMFWKYEKKLLKAIIVGLVGSLAICTLSDILIPLLGGQLLTGDMHAHICIIEEPGIVWPFALIGVLAGLIIPGEIERSTQYSHSAHVFVSSAASILYLVSFGVHHWMDMVGGVFLLTIVAVMLPCCASDIAFPIFCANKVTCNHKH